MSNQELARIQYLLPTGQKSCVLKPECKQSESFTETAAVHTVRADFYDQRAPTIFVLGKKAEYRNTGQQVKDEVQSRVSRIYSQLFLFVKDV